ncbi:uncharacterized protein ACA1_037110 [Acanthamoeba castellanii str. Neff]|uniref:Bms1-type G domain-containing protein n=1 Tax=Acanthamoeba castellanii (strain ATCC 30010 / Neff) TaxID=1257118 RepID=L8H0X3_ACACF|nr:uncharacterized protein ACA1_037110 [Acanthamoeba castellanii str. Neff]ELR18877.1 hypothetical protein ACA1_037110 [Acanthamoeba castellanii str. Neff]
MEGHRHRPGPLKQTNKAFKPGKHATKGELRRKVKGKVGKTTVQQRPSLKKVVGNSRENRKKLQHIKSLQKKAEVLHSKRLGTSAGPPKIIGIISLGANADTKAARSMLLAEASSPISAERVGPITANFPAFKQRMTLFEAPRDIEAVLDIAKVADILLLVIPADGGVDATGEAFLSAVKAQGMPSLLVALQGLAAVPQKNRADIKKQIKEFAEFHFPDFDRVLPLDTADEATQVMRFLSNLRVRQVLSRERRPYLLVDSLHFEPTGVQPSAASGPFAESTTIPVGILKVSGYLRGGPLSANDLVHLPDFGDFQMSQIDGTPDPHPYSTRVPKDGKKGEGMEAEEGEGAQRRETLEILDMADPDKQESLQSEVVPDVMANEQNLTAEDEAEIMSQVSGTDRKKKRKKVPKGYSSYQSAWIVDSDEDEDDDGEGEDDEDDQGSMDLDGGEKGKEHGEMGMDGSEHSNDEGGDNDGDEEDDGEDDGEDGWTEDGDGTETIDMEAAELERERMRQEATEDMKWPDEVQTPMSVKAKIRFQKYRGLKSFRNTPWDPKENLPLDYARIFQFKNFTRTVKKLLDERDGIVMGTYVTLHVLNVPQALGEWINPSRPFVVSGLFKHEHKTTVINFAVQRMPSYTEPVKSKEELIIQCGFRRYRSRPVFSQHSISSDKFKSERFFQPNRNSVATIYGPVMVPPAPVLMFKEIDENFGLSASPKPVHSLRLVAIGSLLSVDPDRVVVKKIVLTGYPYKIHKRGAVIKHMFYHPDDVRWFSPVELWTKYGRSGHIKEPLGTHGLMKCRFDGKIQNHDTVCMNLYKRIYPKWGTTTLLSEKPSSYRPRGSAFSTSSSSASGPSALTAEALARHDAM